MILEDEQDWGCAITYLLRSGSPIKHFSCVILSLGAEFFSTSHAVTSLAQRLLNFESGTTTVIWEQVQGQGCEVSVFGSRTAYEGNLNAKLVHTML